MLLLAAIDERVSIWTMMTVLTGWPVLDKVCSRFNWVGHANCQMTNHYHLLVETVDGHLSKGMRQLNGRYTQQFNRRYEMVGRSIEAISY